MSHTELTKSMHSKKTNDRIPDAESISARLRYCFDFMCTCEPFGRLLTPTDLLNLEHNEYKLGYLVWTSMMRDLLLADQDYFFYPPFNPQLVLPESAEDVLVDRDSTPVDKKIKERFALSSLMGVTTSETKISVTSKGKSYQIKDSMEMKESPIDLDDDDVMGESSDFSMNFLSPVNSKSTVSKDLSVIKGKGTKRKRDAQDEEDEEEKEADDLKNSGTSYKTIDYYN